MLNSPPSCHQWQPASLVLGAHWVTHRVFMQGAKLLPPDMTVVRRQRVAKWARRRTTAALAVAFTAEECDKVLLTSMYLAIGNTLRALPSQLGQLTMWRALVQVSLHPWSGPFALCALAGHASENKGLSASPGSSSNCKDSACTGHLHSRSGHPWQRVQPRLHHLLWQPGLGWHVRRLRLC